MTPDQDPARLQAVRQLLNGQSAPVSSDGLGRAFLAQCPTCGSLFFRDGRRIIPLNVQEVQKIADSLGAALENLPFMLCEPCHRSNNDGGLFEIDEYRLVLGPELPTLYGFGLSWESPGAHLLASLFPISMLPQMADLRPDVVTQSAQLQQSLRWLAQATLPAEAQDVPPWLLSLIASDNPPGHGDPGTERCIWRGVQWIVPQHPLGPTLVVVYQAMPPYEPYSPAITLQCWRVLAGKSHLG